MGFESKAQDLGLKLFWQVVGTLNPKPSNPTRLWGKELRAEVGGVRVGAFLPVFCAYLYKDYRV